MSNTLAIAAVTATLENLLSAVSDVMFGAGAVSGARVTTLPPNKAQEETGNRVNLFLYQTTVNTAWSNKDMPRQVKPGELGFPPLALNLHYLLTAYGQDDTDLRFVSHRLLAQAMSLLHDKPVLDRQAIKDALSGNDLYEQIERVRLTPLPLSVDETSKLWTMFQTPYQISAAYHASVVLVESTRPKKTPLPVLRRGPKDRGAVSRPDLIPPLPTLTHIEPPGRQPSFQLSDKILVHGFHLDGDTVSARLMHPRLEDAVEVAPQPEGTATQATVELSATPDAQTRYPAGIYRLALVVTKTEESGPVSRTSNELPFPLAPQVSVPGNPITDHVLTLDCSPQVWPEQRVVLLLGSSEISAQPHPAKTGVLTFDIAAIPAGRYLARLRVDGVDSLPVQDYDALPLAFDEEQMVTVDE